VVSTMGGVAVSLRLQGKASILHFNRVYASGSIAGSGFYILQQEDFVVPRLLQFHRDF
jgi:hypothetical protein